MAQPGMNFKGAIDEFIGGVSIALNGLSLEDLSIERYHHFCQLGQ